MKLGLYFVSMHEGQEEGPEREERKEKRTGKVMLLSCIKPAEDRMK
jgi:hypothetical protein